MAPVQSTSNLLLNAAAMSADITSPYLDLAGIEGVALEISSPGAGGDTRAGNVHVSMCVSDPQADDTKWVTVASKAVSAATALLWLIDIDRSKHAQYLRVRWAKDGGVMAGTLTISARLRRSK